MMLFAHGADAVGLPPIEAWREVLSKARVQGSFVGVEEAAYPAHFAIYARYHRDLQKIPARYPQPKPLPWDCFECAIAAMSERSSVRLVS
jgi:hypothetical protein